MSSVCRSSSHMRYVSGSLAATSRSRLIQPFRSARTSFTILHAQFLCEAGSHHWFLYSPSAHPCAAVSSRLADYHGLEVSTVGSNSPPAWDSDTDGSEICQQEFRECPGQGTEAHFFSSHLEGWKRRLGSGALDSGCSSRSRVNQSTSASYGSTCWTRHESLTSLFFREVCFCGWGLLELVHLPLVRVHLFPQRPRKSWQCWSNL